MMECNECDEEFKLEDTNIGTTIVEQGEPTIDIQVHCPDCGHLAAFHFVKESELCLNE